MALSDGLISWWKLDEPGGDALDAHGGHNLTDQATVGAAAGKRNGARDFVSANSEYFSVADHADLRSGDRDWTWCGWVFLDSLAGNPVFANKGWSAAGADREWIVYYDSAASRFESQIWDGVGLRILEATLFGAAVVGTWYFLMLRFRASNNRLRFTVNTLSTSSFLAAAPISAAGDFRLGASPGQALFHDGRIDESAWWLREVTDAEQLRLYNGGAGLTYAVAAGRPSLRRRRYPVQW